MDNSTQAIKSNALNEIFFAYLKRILYRTARDYIRQENQRRTCVIYLEDAPRDDLGVYFLGTGPCDFKSQENYHLHLQNELLAKTIPEFNEVDREILYHLFYEDMSTVETAEVMGITQQRASQKKQRLLERITDGFKRSEDS
jgi:RNA polymerase sigma factor (sigma-70 family)